MALTDQPYFPFYVDDYLTDEKLLMCESSSEGVYTRLLCHFHKSDSYGKIIITKFEEAKFKQKVSKLKAKNHLKYLDVDSADFLLYVEKIKSLIGRDYDVVYNALIDLIGNDVLKITDGILWQKRMFEDGEKSLSKARNGSIGGSKPKSKNKAKGEQIPVSVSVTEAVYETVKLLFNKICKKSKNISKLNSERKNKIQELIQEHNPKDIPVFFESAFKRINNSSFLNGGGKNGWIITFDWMIEEENFLKIIEGNFDDNKSSQTTTDDDNR